MNMASTRANFQKIPLVGKDLCRLGCRENANKAINMNVESI